MYGKKKPTKKAPVKKAAKKGKKRYVKRCSSLFS